MPTKKEDLKKAKNVDRRNLVRPKSKKLEISENRDTQILKLRRSSMSVLEISIISFFVILGNTSSKESEMDIVLIIIALNLVALFFDSVLSALKRSGSQGWHDSLK